jgi:D-glycero-D-manno-heptose 1,7-bisphosphate phosphatase
MEREMVCDRAIEVQKGRIMLVWINAPQLPSRPFLYLDRDGVINKDRRDYIKHRREFEFYPDALKALRWLREHRIFVVLISNQSAINRGIITWEDFWDIHHWMLRGVRESGGDILGACYCPHRPDEGCSCRKPSPGMIETAAAVFQIPLTETFFIGDRSSDLLAARRAGCRGVLLDRLGGGIQDQPPELRPVSNDDSRKDVAPKADPAEHSIPASQHPSRFNDGSQRVESYDTLMDAVMALSKAWNV